MGEKLKIIVPGVGALMITICVTLSVIHFADWSKTHSAAITAGMYSSGAIALACFLFWFFTHTDSPPSGAPKTKNMISTRSDTNNSSRNVIAETVHYHESAVQPPELVPPTSASKAHLELRPSIEISGAEKVNVEFFPLRANWNVAPNGRAGVVVWVTNNVASIGQKTVIATNLAVTVRFEDFNGRTFHRVSRAYWLNHSGNGIDLGIGERHEAVSNVR